MLSPYYTSECSNVTCFRFPGDRVDDAPPGRWAVRCAPYATVGWFICVARPFFSLATRHWQLRPMGLPPKAAPGSVRPMRPGRVPPNQDSVSQRGRWSR